MSDPDLAFSRDISSYHGRSAGVVTRTAANALDVAAICGLLALGYAAVNGALFAMDPRGFSGVSARSGWSVVVALVASVTYLTVGWSMAGRTYGCRLMGLRVLTTHRTRIGPFASCVRAFLCVCFPLGLLWCAWDGKDRSLQDLVLHTCVVHDWQRYG